MFKRLNKNKYVKKFLSLPSFVKEGLRVILELIKIPLTPFKKRGNVSHIFAGFLILALAIFGNVQAKFVDVDVTHPYYHAIQSLQDEGVIEGYPEADGGRSFHALQPVNRAEAVKMIMLASHHDIPKSRRAPQGGGEKIFPDVNGSDWFYNFVNAAAKEKIVKGFADGQFHPSAQVTRAEFLKMTLVAFGIPAENLEATDDQQWFEPILEFGRKFRIISDEDTPHQALNRGETAEIIYRTQKVAEKNWEKKYTYSGMGKASYYHSSLAGNPTASGEPYDPEDLTAAHRTLPLGTRLKVKFRDKFVIVRINDRGPYHEDRILDLSEKAFKQLAPLKTGVLNVVFEVYTDPDDEKPEVPDAVRANLSEYAQNPAVPEAVAKVIEEFRGISKRTEKKSLLSKPQPIFPDESVPTLTKDFFPNLELRQNFPRKYLVGSVINFKGRAKELGHKKVTVFLQQFEGKKKIGEQITYSGKVSGKNFAFPVILDKPGNFFIGVVFDDDKKSRTTTIEVVNKKDYRKFAPSEAVFLNDFEVRVLPEEKTVFFDFTNLEQNDLLKLVFSQKNRKQKVLYIYGGIETLPLKYDFFAGFSEFSNLAVDLFAAESLDGTLDTQFSAWQKTSFKNFQLEKAFPDTEDERLKIENFARYFRKLEKITLHGVLNDPKTKLHPQAYITLPNGKVITTPLRFSREKTEFWFDLNPLTLGRYVIEINSDKGEILFNRAIYFSRKIVLPVMPEEMVELTGNSVANVRFWINSVRKNAGRSELISDYRLNDFAQKYANQMAEKGFISHVSPTEGTFENRIKLAGLHGEFGENLSFGTTLDLALQGLKNSASHYQNMTSIRWKKVGIGIKKGRKGWYVVNVFGR